MLQQIHPRTAPASLPERFELTHELDTDLTRWAQIRSRRTLERDRGYRARKHEVERVLAGFEWDLAEPEVVRPCPLGHETARVVAWNVERGKRFAPLVGVLSGEDTLAAADVLMLNEVDIGMGRSDNRNVPRDLARALGLRYVFATSHVVLAPGDQAERGHGVPNGLSLHGNALLTRFPVRRFEAVTLPEYTDKFHAIEKRLGEKRALLVELELPDGPLLCAVVHLDPFSPPSHRAAQLGRVLAHIERLGAGRVLVGGDLNTNTYDLGGPLGFTLNCVHKIGRFGFEGTLDQYMRPDEVFERRLFDALRRRGYSTAGFNDRARGTIYYDINDVDLITKAHDYVPAPLLRWLERRLEPRGGMVPLKVDWFAGRGVQARRAAVIERPTHDGQRISDHNPIVVDLALARPLEAGLVASGRLGSRPPGHAALPPPRQSRVGPANLRLRSLSPKSRQGRN